MAAQAKSEEAKVATWRRRRGHPLLRGCKRERYTHGLHPVQMEALRAMCGALIPSLPVPEDGIRARGSDASKDDLERFYLASAADGTIPDEVVELVSRCVWEAVVLVHVVLWILSTKVGTLALCGWQCVSGKFPYVCKFADMPVKRREEALTQWNRTRWLFPLKITFAVIKILSHLAFYTMVTENSNNPCWKAMGYSVPDMEETREDQSEAAPSPRPLDDGVVETKALNDATLLRSLMDKGLVVQPDVPGSAYHTVHCDVVIVGSGCGGGVAAAVLASAGHKVVVVEKGDYFTAEDYTSLEGPSMERLYEQGGIFCTTNVTTILFTGATVGGGSAVNWSASIRTPEDVRQEWAREHGLPRVRELRVRAGHGRGVRPARGHWRVPGGGVPEQGGAPRLRGAPARRRRRAAQLAGGPFLRKLPHRLPHRREARHRHDVVGRRRGAARGAVVLTGCKAERFVLESSSGGNARSRKCVGLVARCASNGITKKLRIEAKVSIVACGALMTPPLLRNSGLKNRHIGRNLHLHPVSMAWGYFPEENKLELTGRCFEGGIITSMHRVTERTIVETPALGPGCFGSMVLWVSGRDMKERMRRYARTAHAFALVRDRGAGTVDGEGRVCYAPARDDVDELRNGLRRALRILVAAGAAEVGTHRSDGLRLRCDGGVRDEDLEAFLDEVTIEKGPMRPGPDKWALHCSAHQMGSCRMGASPRDGAVDGRGESWEAKGLYVCDGSLLPTAVGVNPMITIQSIAYCLSKGIAESLAQPQRKKQ